MVTQKFVRTSGAISDIWSVYGIWLDQERARIGFFLQKDLFSFMRAQQLPSCINWHPIFKETFLTSYFHMR